MQDHGGRNGRHHPAGKNVKKNRCKTVLEESQSGPSGRDRGQEKKGEGAKEISDTGELGEA